MRIKISLTKFEQKNRTFYLMKADPREIISRCKYEDANKLQEYQRPWNPKRVKAIADYVHGDATINDETADDDSKKAQGFIPNCPLLNTIESVIMDNGDDCYLELPEPEVKCFEILDGQHRLISFDSENCRIADDETYEMGFVVCNKLTGDLKKEIFVIPNRTQEKVDKDVILSMMESLNILDETRSRHYRLLLSLNKEESSPLKGRIKIGGEKISRGLAPKALMKIFDESDLIMTLDRDAPDKELDYVISYLSAWSKVFPEMNENKSHTLNKIAGFRYIMYLSDTIMNIIRDEKKTWNEDDITSVVRKLRYEIIDPDQIFERSKDINPFAGETTTKKLAKDHSKRLEQIYKGESFNIFQ